MHRGFRQNESSGYHTPMATSQKTDNAISHESWLASVLQSLHKQPANSRDSLFGLPLQPMPAPVPGSVNRSAQALTDEVSRACSHFSPSRARRQLTTVSEDEWLERGQRRALALFHAAAEHVPAYKDFLFKNGIKADSIRTIHDFQQVPPVEKNNYLRAYPLEQLCWYGHLPSSQMISVSSGSSGKPFFWPRAQILDAETALEHELFLSTFFEMDRYSTLFVVCFAMGMYVAGPITMNSVLHMGRKGYPVTVVTPGYSPEDVLKVVPELAPKFDQVVFAGYPPYVKEIIDKGIEQGIKWSDIKLRFLLAGEGFNESWRTYVAALAGDKSPVHDFLNLYGSADAAVLGQETTASIVVRRRVFDDSAARLKLFHDERLPSLLQFYPEHKYFENLGEEVLFTAPGGIPLVRYNIHDRGGVLFQKDFTDAIPALGEYFNELKREQKLWNLPFVYVFGKSDQTAIVYGANVYPENIKRALENENVRQQVSGKFIIHTDLDENKDQRFCIDLECANGVSPDANLTKQLGQFIHETLISINSEYRSSYQGTGDKIYPRIKLYSKGDQHFCVGIKHKWTQ